MHLAEIVVVGEAQDVRLVLLQVLIQRRDPQIGDSLGNEGVGATMFG
jgi:hypothetical protein